MGLKEIKRRFKSTKEEDVQWVVNFTAIAGIIVAIILTVCIIYYSL